MKYRLIEGFVRILSHRRFGNRISNAHSKRSSKTIRNINRPLLPSQTCLMAISVLVTKKKNNESKQIKRDFRWPRWSKKDSRIRIVGEISWLRQRTWYRNTRRMSLYLIVKRTWQSTRTTSLIIFGRKCSFRWEKSTGRKSPIRITLWKKKMCSILMYLCIRQ